MTTNVETPQAASSPATDAPADSSPAVEVVADSTPAGAPAEFNARLDALEGTKPPEDSPPAKAEVTDEAAKGEVTQDEPDKPKADSPDPKVLSQDVAFDKRPEWQELKKLTPAEAAKIKPTIRKLMERETHLTEQVKVLKPAETVVNRLKAATGDDAGFNNAIQLIEQYQSDPAGSVAMLERLLTDARKRGGLEISSVDLKGKAEQIQKLVDDGRLTEEEATGQREVLLEAEKARAAKAQAEKSKEATERGLVDRQTQDLIESRRVAIAEQGKLLWDKDPDFPKLENRFIDRGTLMLEAKTRQEGGKWLDNKEVNEVLAEAWKQVKAETAALLPKPKATRAIVNTGSSRTSNGQPKDARDAFMQRIEALEGG